MAKNASKIVSSAILGLDGETLVVGEKVYFITPPTIRKIALAAYHLSDIGEGDTLREMFIELANSESVAKALSCLIEGDESLAEELSKCTFEEVVDALDKALSLISAQSFWKLSALARSVRSLTAKQKL